MRARWGNHVRDSFEESKVHSRLHNIRMTCVNSGTVTVFIMSEALPYTHNTNLSNLVTLLLAETEILNDWMKSCRTIDSSITSARSLGLGKFGIRLIMVKLH